MIPENILAKYSMETLEQRIAFLQPPDAECEKQIEKNFYQEFLDNTDYEMIKAFETLFSEPSKFLTNIISLYKDYSEIITWRAYARSELLK